jgi:hypothetical protein
MKKLASLIIIAFSVFHLSFVSSVSYDPSFVKTTRVKHNNVLYTMIDMNRDGSGKRIKVKYFSSRDYSTGKSVSDRFKEWRKKRDIICYSSGAYMIQNGNYYTPEGFNVDNGAVVNSVLEKDRFDALVIVYATGGMVATNLKEGDLTLGDFKDRKFDLRNRPVDKSTFENWCTQNGATAFQTHLLMYKDQIKMGVNSSEKKAKRRFLAVGNIKGEIHHTIVQFDLDVTLYEATKMVNEFLKANKNMQVIYMINLDTGAQDVFGHYKTDGTLDPRIQGEEKLESATNLLVYYYE